MTVGEIVSEAETVDLTYCCFFYKCRSVHSVTSNGDYHLFSDHNSNTEMFKMDYVFHLVLLLLPLFSMLGPPFANRYASATPVGPSDLYLPPGWTQERLDKASAADIMALPPNVSYPICST